jgi:hypothetical protein
MTAHQDWLLELLVILDIDDSRLEPPGGNLPIEQDISLTV